MPEETLPRINQTDHEEEESAEQEESDGDSWSTADIVLRHVAEFLASDEQKSDKITLETEIRSIAGYDSLAYMELLICIEDDFYIAITESMIDTIRTVGDLVDVVEECIKSRDKDRK